MGKKLFFFFKGGGGGGGGANVCNSNANLDNSEHLTYLNYNKALHV